VARDAGSRRRRLGFGRRLGPVCRDQEATAIRYDDDQVWSTVAVSSAEDLKDTVLEGVMPADDPNQLRNIVDVGSLRRFPSTRSARNGWSASWSTGSPTRASSA